MRCGDLGMIFYFHPDNSHHHSPPSRAWSLWDALLVAPQKDSTSSSSTSGWALVGTGVLLPGLLLSLGRLYHMVGSRHTSSRDLSQSEAAVLDALPHPFGTEF